MYILFLFTWSRKTGFFCTDDSNAIRRKSSVVWQFILPSTSTSCNSCFKTTKYICLDCRSHYLSPVLSSRKVKRPRDRRVGLSVRRYEERFKDLTEETADEERQTSATLQLYANLIRGINDVLDRELNKDWRSGNDWQHAKQFCSTQLYSTSEMHVAQNKLELTQTWIVFAAWEMRRLNRA